MSYMWSRDDIAVYFEPIQWFAKDYGLIASVYGSVVTKGFSDKDLDIMVVPYVHNPDIESFILCVKNYFKGKIINSYNGITAKSVVIDIDDKKLDISIRKVIADDDVRTIDPASPYGDEGDR